MLELQKINNQTTVTVDDAKLKAKTEAYLVEVLTQKLADLFMARHGEALLAQLDRDELVINAKKRILQIINEESQRGVRDN